MQVGVDLFGQGLLLLPFIGVVAVMRGLLIAVVALLYVLFAAEPSCGEAGRAGLALRQRSSTCFL